MVRRKELSILIFAFVAAVCAFQFVSADRFTSTSYLIDASVLNEFGGSGSSTSYQLESSGGENVVGDGAGGSYKIGMGYIAQLEKSLTLTVQPSGLVGYWPFDDGSGSVAYDVSVYANNGVYSSGSTFVTGKVGAWAWADTTGAQDVEVAYNAQLPSGDKLTVSAWIYHADTAEDGIVTQWQYGTGPGNGAWAFETTSGGTQLRFFVKNGYDPGDNYVDTTNANLSTNTWYHVAAVYDGAQTSNNDRVKIYLNGVELSKNVVGTIASTLTATTAKLAIGDFPDLNRQWSGAIDEVKLYNRALSQTELAAEYSAGNVGVASGLSLGTIVAGISSSVLSDVIVQTDASGYSLAISQDHDLTNGGYTIPAISGSIASPVAWSEGTTKGLGFTLTDTNATAIPGGWGSGGNYAAFPGTATTFYTRGGLQSGDDYLTLRLKADVSATQVATPTPYTNTITVIGTVTP